MSQYEKGNRLKVNKSIFVVMLALEMLIYAK